MDAASTISFVFTSGEKILIFSETPFLSPPSEMCKLGLGLGGFCRGQSAQIFCLRHFLLLFDFFGFLCVSWKATETSLRNYIFFPFLVSQLGGC